ncbi:conserved hypothetical protein [Trichinella spiralis]|uniref:hypothetical protein n=1 Tax=Trichinella spiralis TaxID=6334 RepID=UPI0001EFEB8D|nr:conserved hypothetical protein [Trichinella spiralis]
MSHGDFVKCNGPLPRAGSSASSTGLLTRPSLFGDGPVFTGAFPFRSVSRFPDGIATTKQQAMSIYSIRQSETRIDDDVNTNYRTPPPIFMKNLISSVRVRCKGMQIKQTVQQMNEIENTSNDSAPDFVIVCPAVIRLSIARIADFVAWPEVVDISGHGCSTLCFEPDPMIENKRQYLR